MRKVGGWIKSAISQQLRTKVIKATNKMACGRFYHSAIEGSLFFLLLNLTYLSIQSCNKNAQNRWPRPKILARCPCPFVNAKL